MTGARRLPPGGFLEEEEVRRLFDALDGGGETIKVVGGAVRNALIGRPAGDIDFATTATPDRVAARAEAAGLKVVPTGVEHGTLTVIVAGRPFEVTTLRADVETDGRRAKVAFGRDWKADAARRDFTINALYVDRGGLVCDPLGGWSDLMARRVRFIGEPRARIREDRLRILRFFRFTAEYGEGPIDSDGLTACIRERRGLERLSRERIRQETMRLLSAPRAVEVLEMAAETGFAAIVLKGVTWIPAFARLAAIETALGLPADPIVRLAALAVRIREDAERLSTALRLSRSETATLAALVRLRPLIPIGAPERSVEAFLYRKRAEPVAQAVRFAWALSGAPPDDPAWTALHAKALGWRPPASPFKGADLIRLGLRPGPEIGIALAFLERWWIEAGFPMEPPALDDARNRAVGFVRSR